MPALEDLKTARDTLATTLKDNAGKPNYSVDGQSVSWGELFDRLQKLNERIAEMEPFEEEIIANV